MISFFALVISLRISFRISALKAFMSNAGGSENSDPFTCCKICQKQKSSLEFSANHFPFIFDGKPHQIKTTTNEQQTFKIVSSLALPKRFRDCGESASDDVAFDDEDDGSVCELLLLNLCGSVFDFSHFSRESSPS